MPGLYGENVSTAPSAKPREQLQVDVSMGSFPVETNNGTQHSKYSKNRKYDDSFPTRPYDIHAVYLSKN